MALSFLQKITRAVVGKSKVDDSVLDRILASVHLGNDGSVRKRRRHGRRPGDRPVAVEDRVDAAVGILRRDRERSRVERQRTVRNASAVGHDVDADVAAEAVLSPEGLAVARLVPRWGSGREPVRTEGTFRVGLAPWETAVYEIVAK